MKFSIEEVIEENEFRVVEKERRLALPLTRTEGLRTDTITPGKAWRLAPVTWLDFLRFDLSVG